LSEFGNSRNLALDYDALAVNLDIRANSLHSRTDKWDLLKL
jgi:hypothetical protein